MVSKNFEMYIAKVKERQERLNKKVPRFAVKEIIGFIPGIGPLIKDAINEFEPKETEKILNEFKAFSEDQFENISKEIDISVRDLKLIKRILLDELPDIPDLLDFCKNQVENSMSHLKASSKGEFKNKKYSSELYVRRKEIESIFSDFLAHDKNPDRNCFAVVGEAGVGKTNLFCRLAEDLVGKYPTLFYNGFYLTDNIEAHIMDDFKLQFGIKGDFFSIIGELDSLMSSNGMYFVVFIDAVNEYQKPYNELKTNIANILIQLAKVKANNIKFCISCRDIGWDFFIKNNERLTDNLYIPYSGIKPEEEYEETKELRWATLKEFNEDEFKESWKNYKRSFNLKEELSEEAKEVCKQPLMLRFLCEGYEGEELPTDIRRLQIFDKYWDRKLEGTGESGNAKKFLFTIIEKMREQRKAELSKNKVETVTGETTDEMKSIFNKVLDEHIIIYLREKGKRQIKYVGFTYEAFFEYAIARMIIATQEWDEDKDQEQILKEFEGYVKESEDYRSMIGAIQFLVLLMENKYADDYIKMLEYLTEINTEWKRNACETIAKLSQTNERIVKILKKLASEDAWQVRKAAANCLSEARVEKSQLMDLINQWAEDEDVKVRITTAWSLAKIGVKYPKECIEIIAKMFKDEDPNVKKYAKEALGEIGRIKPEETLLLLKEFVGGKEWNVRLAVVSALGEIGKNKPEETIPLLQELVKDEREIVRLAVASALGEIGKNKTEETIPLLQELAKDERVNVRSAVGFAIGKIKSEETILILQELAKVESVDVRLAVASALGKIKLEETIAIPLLQELVKDEREIVRSAVASALGEIDKLKPEETIPLLKELAKDERVNVRSAVASALGKIKLEETIAIPLLQELAKVERENIRSAVASTLGEIGKKKPEETILILQELAKVESVDVRSAVASALGEIGKNKPEETLPLMKELVEGKEWKVRWTVASALGEIGKLKPEETLPLLKEWTKDERGDVRWTVTSALGEIGKNKPEETLPLLKELAKGKERYVKPVASALWEIYKVKPEETLPLLKEWTKDENEDIREVAKEAIQKIQRL